MNVSYVFKCDSAGKSTTLRNGPMKEIILTSSDDKEANSNGIWSGNKELPDGACMFGSFKFQPDTKLKGACVSNIQ